MAPSALFDKSFLQALSTDEAVWFDHFMMPVICPIFIVETLGDLFKDGKERQGVEDLRSLAIKALEKEGQLVSDAKRPWKLKSNQSVFTTP